jgi:hypothetical protein
MRSAWVEALYYSGYTGATLGFGDLVLELEAMRLRAPVQPFGGYLSDVSRHFVPDRLMKMTISESRRTNHCLLLDYMCNEGSSPKT